MIEDKLDRAVMAGDSGAIWEIFVRILYISYKYIMYIIYRLYIFILHCISTPVGYLMPNPVYTYKSNIYDL